MDSIEDIRALAPRIAINVGSTADGRYWAAPAGGPGTVEGSKCWGDFEKEAIRKAKALVCKVIAADMKTEDTPWHRGFVFEVVRVASQES